MLPPTKEAVALYRELTAVRPDRYIPALATSLSHLGNIRSALGRTAMLQRPALRLRNTPAIADDPALCTPDPDATAWLRTA
jgi:hypothetical protein